MKKNKRDHQMKKNIFLFIILNFILVNLSSSAEIKLSSDPWCPFTCEPNSDKPGFMVEIAKEIFKSAGHDVIYVKLNWARALADAKAGVVNGVVGAAKYDVPGFILPTRSNAKSFNYFFVLKDDPWFFNGVDSLKGKEFVIINGYSYGSVVDKLIAKKHKSFKKLSGEDPLLRMIQMTESNRINGFIEDSSVLSYKLNSLMKKSDLFKVASANLAIDPNLYIAFSPTNPHSKEYAKILDEGMIKLRKSGRLAEILKKYSLKDWE